jgi:hypothetical protein
MDLCLVKGFNVKLDDSTDNFFGEENPPNPVEGVDQLQNPYISRDLVE